MCREKEEKFPSLSESYSSIYPGSHVPPFIEGDLAIVISIDFREELLQFRTVNVYARLFERFLKLGFVELAVVVSVYGFE
jgi:hypothetical protein